MGWIGFSRKLVAEADINRATNGSIPHQNCVSGKKERGQEKETEEVNNIERRKKGGREEGKGKG